MESFYFSIGLAVLAAIAWGINSHIVKHGMINANPYFAMLARSSVSFPILFLIAGFSFGYASLTQYFSPTKLPLVMASAFLIVLGDGLFMLALKYYPVKLIVPISSVYPLVTAFILIVGRVEQVRFQILVGTFLTVIGIYLVTRGEGNGSITLRPLILGLTTSVFWGSSIVIVRLILQDPNTEAIGLTGARTFFMGLFSLILLVTIPKFREEIRNAEKQNLLHTIKYLAMSGIIGWVIGASAFFFAVQKIGASIATPITSTNPIIASILGVILGTENISAIQLYGIIITVIGTIIIVI
ncbi:MAG: DMT family transporter [Methanobacteriota archaeon]|nr:MAG: DMT family transporter [Euryarchaeota archaeon]